MNCTDARLALSVAGRQKQELSAPDQRILEQHLSACPDCAALAADERHFDEAIGRAMHAVPLPLNLAQRILAGVARERKPRYWPWVAAAASVVLAAGLGLYFVLRPAPTIDVEQFAANLDQRACSSPEAVEQWFAAQGVAMKAPRDFLYGTDPRETHLESYDVEVVDGRKIAHLVFLAPGDRRHEGALAHVYVLPVDALDFSGEIITRIPASKHNIELIPPPDAATPFYVMVVYTGRSLDPFRPRRG